MNPKVFLFDEVSYNTNDASYELMTLVAATMAELEAAPDAILVGWDLSQHDPADYPLELYICRDGILHRNADGSYTRLAADDPSIPGDYDKAMAQARMADLDRDKVPDIIWFQMADISTAGDYEIYATTGTLEQLNGLEHIFLDAATRRYPALIDDSKSYLLATADGKLVRPRGNSEPRFAVYQPPTIDEAARRKFVSSYQS